MIQIHSIIPKASSWIWRFSRLEAPFRSHGIFNLCQVHVLRWMARSAPIAKAWRKVSDASVAVNHGTMGTETRWFPTLSGPAETATNSEICPFLSFATKKTECPENSRIKKSWYVYNHKKGAMDVDNRYKQCNHIQSIHYWYCFVWLWQLPLDIALLYPICY